MPALCRDCFEQFEAGTRCPSCRSPCLVAHPELFKLSIAHLDCDAFYASVEKRDNPKLRQKPVIIGGGRRGVVSTACYIARIKGVRSAMPMFKALKLCPEAVVLRGRMEVYAAVSRQIRELMLSLSPDVEPLSLDEAFINMSGTRKLHGAPPAVMLAQLIHRIEKEVGITSSIGLSHNKFLAKIASDMDKPRGFFTIGLEESEDFLEDRPVSLIWGVGKACQSQLNRAGIRRFRDLRRWDKAGLKARFGSMGEKLWYLARGQDKRVVKAHRVIKSISHEVTFSQDTVCRDILDGHIWRLSEKVADRAKARDLVGRIVTLKLKRADHKVITRRLSLDEATQIGDRIYRSARALLDRIEEGWAYRLVGVGISDLEAAGRGDLGDDFLDPTAARRAEVERASDRIRARFGTDAIIKGRALR